MKKEASESRPALQAENRRLHPIWRGIFIYSIICNLTIILTMVFTGRELKYDSYPILSTMVFVVYVFSEIFLLLVSPFFIRRFGTLATLGLIVAFINFPLILSLCART
jgi:membrane-associated HD superfamily phosphohydrolase